MARALRHGSGHDPRHDRHGHRRPARRLGRGAVGDRRRSRRARTAPPGRVRRWTLDDTPGPLDTHGVDVAAALALARVLGTAPKTGDRVRDVE
ncbi:hypothetical protein GS506_23330 [Rhodococcus hoagii]|nr:hypothetical protein [Prescottella equi]